MPAQHKFPNINHMHARQLVVLHQSPIESLIPLRLLRLRIDLARALSTSTAMTAHLHQHNGLEILTGKYLRIRLSGEIYAQFELSGRSGKLINSLKYIYAHRQLQSAKRKAAKSSSHFIRDHQKKKEEKKSLPNLSPKSGQKSP